MGSAIAGGPPLAPRVRAGDLGGSDAFLSGLAPADLDRDLDLALVGQGRRTLGWALLHMRVGHCDQITGEIACLKGLQGRGGPG